MNPTRITVTLLLMVAQLATCSQIACADRQPARRIGLPPQLASVVKLTAEQQGNAILLHWETVAGSDGYRIYHEAGDDLQAGSSWFDVNGQSSGSYLYTDVTATGHYSFRVAALYGRKESATSPLATVIMQDKTTGARSDAGK